MQMKNNIKTYDKYKDSSIDWIGKIPEEWKIAKLAWTSLFINGYAFDSNKLDIDGEVPVIRIGDIQQNKVNYESCLKADYNEILATYRPQKNDIVIAMSGATTGKIAVIVENKNAYINQRVGIIRNKANNFIKYCLDNSSFLQYIDLLSAGSAQPNISMGNILDYKVPYISSIEQQAIAEYLDKKCGKIDEVIETEKKVIEKLKEYKQSVITEAVTKGLDKSVPLKDSGIEWIGKIPQHWEVCKIKKSVEKIADIDHYMPNSVENGFPYLMTGDLKDYISHAEFEKCKQISDTDYQELSKKIHPQKNDIIMARYATIGTVSYVDIDKDFLVSYSCLTIRPKDIIGKLLYYYFKSKTFLIDTEQACNSNTQSNIGLDILGNLKIVYSDNKQEQQAIADYLDKKCADIDNAIVDKEAVIEKMTEYKKSLIYECVTGKRKVA